MWNVFYINNFSLVPCFKRTTTSRIKLFFILVLLLVSGFFYCALLNGEEQQHEPLNYEVSVSVTGVPFLAVDEKGKPVYDLKEDELELYVNRRLTPIHKLTGMVFRDMTGSDDRELSAGQEPEPLKDHQTIKPSRLVILVVDSLFNSNTGLSYSKQLARKIIENSTTGDLFLLLEIELGKNGGQVFYAYTISVNVDEEIGRSGICGRLKRLRVADYRDGGGDTATQSGMTEDKVDTEINV